MCSTLCLTCATLLNHNSSPIRAITVLSIFWIRKQRLDCSLSFLVSGRAEIQLWSWFVFASFMTSP